MMAIYIDAVKPNRLNMFIRNMLCDLKGHRLKTSTKHICGMFVIGKTYCNRCGIIMKTKIMGGI